MYALRNALSCGLQSIKNTKIQRFCENNNNKIIKNKYQQFNLQRQQVNREFHSSQVQRKKCHYEILDLPKSASQSDIKRAYLELAKKYHPDKQNSDFHSSEKFLEISEAYGVLSDETKRLDYDMWDMCENSGNGVVYPESFNSDLEEFRDIDLFMMMKDKK